MNKKNVIITGGAGFLGSHVTKLLLNEKYNVTIIDDFSNGKWLHLNSIKNHPDLMVVEADITKKEKIEKYFKNTNYVIHLAVLDLRQSIKEPKRVNRVIVDGTLNCLECSLQNEIELFLNCSSSEVYGTAQYVPMDENHPLLPETPYAAAKVAQDMYVASFGRTFGLPWTTIRPFNMYGPHSHWQGFRGELIPKMIVRAMNREKLVVFGEGNQTRDFTFVSDAASALVKVMETKECMNKVLNFSTGEETSIKRIAELICFEFSLNPDEFIEKQPPRPGDVKRHMGDNTRLKNLIDFKPKISLGEGIKKTISWMHELKISKEELLAQEKMRNWE